MNLLLACLIIFLVLFGGTIATLLSSLYGRLKTVQAPSLPSVNLNYKIEWWKAALIGLAVYIAVAGTSFSGCNYHFPNIGWPLHSKPDAVTYVYEKDDGEVPAAVKAALSTLNEQGITANPFDVDTKDGDTQVPDQYKVPLAAAKQAGLPALVATAGDSVVKVVKAPKTVEEVLEVVK